ncbi:MAG: hypothetical protein QOG62_1738 [Thermoleophilaceae bacterium]|jgi:glycosyltransferase involved in cell wall biosynthesis|nr:hypothetical protein [Thermoleophilaceae bacterium]
MNASVIIPAHNAADTIGATLDALAAQEGAGEFEVIVVDDASTDSTPDLVESHPLPTLVRQPTGMGPAKARNRGAQAATGEVLAFTDADCVPSPGWLAAGMAALEHADLAQGAVRPPEGVAIGPFDRTVWVVAETGLYETANLFATRELFDHLGGFESWIDPRGGKELAEDVWFGWRAIREGATTEFAPGARVDHAVFPRGMREYLAERRRLRFFPRIASRIPELRGRMFFAYFFLSMRSAAFDLALAGVIAAVIAWSFWPLVALLPYALVAGREAVRWRKRAPVVLMGRVAADAVGFAALLYGSVAARSLVL